MTSTTKAFATLAFALALGCHNSEASEGGTVDSLMVRRVDVDADGVADEVRLRVWASAFDKPFYTEIEVRAAGKVLLRRADVDTALDKWFADSAFMGGCIGYARCKAEWYYSDLLRKTVLDLPSGLGPGVYAREYTNSIYHVAKQHLRESCGASEAGADTAIVKAVDRMKSGKTVAIVLGMTPVQSAAPLVWFPEYRCFAPVYME